MRNRKTKRIGQLIVLFFFSVIQTYTKAQQLQVQLIDSFVQRTMSDWHVAGVCIGILTSDSVVFLKGYGYRDYKKRLPFSTRTIFPIASNSKPFTATLALMAENEKKINLDSPIHKYLPELVFYKKELTSIVTVRDLICHRSGLPGHDWAWTFNTNFPGKEYFSRINHLEFSAPVRSRFQYSNFSYVMLSELGETIFGLTWDKLLKVKIFDPLEMKNSYSKHSLVPPDGEIANSYNFKDSFVLRSTGSADDLKGAISVNSTGEDLCNWIQFWLKKGKFNNLQVLPSEYVRSAISSQFVVGDGLAKDPNRDKIFDNMGLGWFLTSYRGHYMVAHDGNIDGFRSEISFFPDDNFGIFVLANQNGSTLGRLITYFIIDHWLKLPIRDLNTQMLQTFQKFKAKRDSGDLQLDTLHFPFSHSGNKYTGQFYNEGYGKLELKKIGDFLGLSIEGNDFALVPKKGDAFTAYYIEDKIGFDAEMGEILLKPDVKGAIQSVSVPFEQGVSNIVFKRVKK